MKDSDSIRRFVQHRLLELELDAAVVSVQLGFNRGYLHDYVVKGTPKNMAAETKMTLATLLKVPPASLGLPSAVIAANGGLSESDAEPYIPAPGSFLAPSETIGMFVIKSNALDQAATPILKGDVVVFDMTCDDPAEIAAGTVVVSQLYDRIEFLVCHGTLVRIFMPPDKLLTNSSGANEIFALNDPGRPYTAKIRGVFRSVVRGIN